ncbi:MAG: hypothetical protein OIF54_16410, partial [Cohaesibacter sp.]|nr:hypothetical protein [Cohaesibacter sp.]
GAATGFGDPSPAALAAALGQPSDDAAALVSAIEPAAGDEAEAPVSSIEPAAGDAVMDQEKIEEPVQNIEIKINNQKTHDAMKEIQKNVEEALKP